MAERRLLPWVVVILVAATVGVGSAWLFNPTPLRVPEVSVPAMRGMARDSAIAELADLGLRGRVGGELADPLTPRGTISWQSPSPETVVPEGTTIRLGVSTGAPRVEVPDVVGFDVSLADQVLEAAGLVLQGVDSVRSQEAAGAILRTDPAARTPARSGTGVQVTVSRGPTPAPTRSQR